ncbi:MAG: hypothetical protein GY856_55240 [bacterium]|nr:hypothetical protein [bacterium]
METIGASDPYISGDGTVIAGTVDDGGINKAAVWTSGTSWQSLDAMPGGAPCGSDLSSAWAVSGDGSVIVGLAWLGCSAAHAFRWDAVNGMVDLGSLDGGNSRANGVSADGTTVVGWDEDPSTGSWRGARWVNGAESLIDGAAVGDAWAANSDGSIIVGGYAGPVFEEAYRWTAATGAVPIGVLPGFNYSGVAADLSEDGNLIIGMSGWGADRRGFAWTPSDGMVYIDDYLTAAGVPGLDQWSLDTPTTITPEKGFIAGWGYGPSSGLHGFLVELPGSSLFTDGFESGDTSAWSTTTGGVF